MKNINSARPFRSRVGTSTPAISPTAARTLRIHDALGNSSIFFPLTMIARALVTLSAYICHCSRNLLSFLPSLESEYNPKTARHLQRAPQ